MHCQMLSKIGIGTANFTQNYGILPSDDAIDVNSILKLATDHGIDTFDTAFAYGDFLSILDDKSDLSNLNVITKFSILDDYDAIFQKMKHVKEQYSFDGYYGLLIHDPQNLERADKGELLSLFDKLHNGGLVKKIGISVYDLNDLEGFRNIIDPELIQIPLSPLSQTFVNDKFIDYVERQEIEVHARSLFLQGVLLSDKLPESLNNLEPLWRLYMGIFEQHSEMYMDATKSYNLRLEALLSWAFTHQWVSKWILGVSCKQDLEEIIESNNQEISHPFSSLKYMAHPMTDPRNWKMA